MKKDISHDKSNYRIYLFLLSIICMNPFLYTAPPHPDNLQQINSSDHSLNSSSEDDDSSWGLPPLNSSESHSFGSRLDEIESPENEDNISENSSFSTSPTLRYNSFGSCSDEIESPENEDNISENSSFSTSPTLRYNSFGSLSDEIESTESEDNIFENSSFSTSRFMISTPVEENPLDNTAPETNSSETKNNIVLSSNIASTANSSSNKMEEESSEANSSQKRKLDNSSQQLSSKKAKKDTSSLDERTYIGESLKAVKKNSKKTKTSEENSFDTESIEDDPLNEDFSYKPVSRKRSSKKANNIKPVKKTPQETITDEVVQNVRTAIEEVYDRMAHNQSVCTAIEEYNNRSAHNNVENDKLFFEIFFKTVLGFNEPSLSGFDNLIKSIEESKKKNQYQLNEKQNLIAYVCYTIYNLNFKIMSLLSQVYHHLGFDYFDKLYNRSPKDGYLSKLKTKYNSNPKYEQLKEMIDEKFVKNDLILISRVKEKLKDINASFNVTDSITYPSDSSSNEIEEEPTSPLIAPTQVEEYQPDITAEADSSETIHNNALDSVSSNNASTPKPITCSSDSSSNEIVEKPMSPIVSPQAGEYQPENTATEVNPSQSLKRKIRDDDLEGIYNVSKKNVPSLKKAPESIHPRILSPSELNLLNRTRTAIEKVLNIEHNPETTLQQFFQAFIEEALGFKQLYLEDNEEKIKAIVDRINASSGEQLSDKVIRPNIFVYVCYIIYGFNPKIISFLNQICETLGLGYLNRFNSQPNKGSYLYYLEMTYSSVKGSINELFDFNKTQLNQLRLSKLKSRLEEICTSKKSVLSFTKKNKAHKLRKLIDQEPSDNLCKILQTFLKNAISPENFQKSPLSNTTLSSIEMDLFNTISEKFKEKAKFDISEKSYDEKRQFFIEFFHQLFAYEKLKNFEELKEKIKVNSNFSESLKNADEGTLRMYICNTIYGLSSRSIAFLSRLCEFLKLDYLIANSHPTVQKSLEELESANTLKQRETFIHIFREVFTDVDIPCTTSIPYLSKQLNAIFSPLYDTTAKDFRT